MMKAANKIITIKIIIILSFWSSSLCKASLYCRYILFFYFVTSRAVLLAAHAARLPWPAFLLLLPYVCYSPASHVSLEQAPLSDNFLYGYITAQSFSVRRARSFYYDW